MGGRLLTAWDRIESMKMETVIRSPQAGVIKKLAHKEGVSPSVHSIFDVSFANDCHRTSARPGLYWSSSRWPRVAWSVATCCGTTSAVLMVSPQGAR